MNNESYNLPAFKGIVIDAGHGSITYTLKLEKYVKCLIIQGNDDIKRTNTYFNISSFCIVKLLDLLYKL